MIPNKSLQTRKRQSSRNAAGFSVLELIAAMAITLALLMVASGVLASAFKIRSRENTKTEALSDAQRGLNLITREVANAGYGLTDNGIVSGDSGLTSIRVRANLNAADGEATSATASDKDEDVKFMLYTDSGNSYIVRLDVNVAAQEMVLANRVDALNIRYYPDKVFYTTGYCDITNVVDSAGNTVNEVTSKSEARYIVISVCVRLPKVGSEGSPGFQPESRVQLVSDAALRNSDLVNY